MSRSGAWRAGTGIDSGAGTMALNAPHTGRLAPARDPVLVTGGAGYVGSHIVLALRDAGYRVVVLDDLSTGDRGAVPVGVALIQADAGDDEAVRGAIERYGVAAAVHAAADLGDTARAAARNRAVSAAFVAACAGAGVRRLVLTSSAAVYGEGPNGPIDESRVPAAERPYGAGKLASETAVRAGFGTPGFGYVILRCFNVAGADRAGRAGPGAGTALVNAACEAALGLRGPVTVYGTDYPTRDGTCVRDYVHAWDVAAAHAAALGALERGLGAATLNCGSARGHTVREVLAEVAACAGVAPCARAGPRRPGDAAVSIAAIGWAAQTLGWRPRQGGLRTIVRSNLAWTRSLHREAAAS